MTHQPSSVVVPLYIFPDFGNTDSAWQRVLNEVTRCSKVTFHIVVNPASGPIAPDDPDHDRSAAYSVYTGGAVSSLRAKANVNILGYVHTSNGSRPANDITNDIDIWMAWPEESRPQGIFFDEATNGGPPYDTAAVAIMEQVSNYARSNGFGTLVFNCGSMFFDPLLFTYADQIIIFEGAYTGTAGVFPARTYSNTIQGRVARQNDGRQAAIDAQNGGYTLRSPQNLDLPDRIRQWSAGLAAQKPPVLVLVIKCTLLMYGFSVPYSTGSPGQQQAGYNNIRAGLGAFDGLVGNICLTDAGLDSNGAAWTSLGTTFASTFERTDDYVNGNVAQSTP